MFFHPANAVMLFTVFSMANHYYEYNQIEDYVFSLPPIRRNLNTTSIRSEEKGQMSLQYRIFYFISNLGGFYTIWVVFAGIILKPIFGRILEYRLVNSYMKAIETNTHLEKVKEIKKEKKRVTMIKTIRESINRIESNEEENKHSELNPGSFERSDGPILNENNKNISNNPDVFGRSAMRKSIFSWTKSNNEEYLNEVKKLNYDRSLIKHVENVDRFEFQFKNLQKMLAENMNLDQEIEKELKLINQSPGIMKNMGTLQPKEWTSSENINSQNNEAQVSNIQQKEHVKSIHNIVNNEIKSLEQDIIRWRPY